MDAILANKMRPDISREFLTRMEQRAPIQRLTVRADGQGFSVDF